MKILLVTECLRVGGAQIFALRLLSTLGKSHEVKLLYLYKDLIDINMVRQYDVENQIVAPRILFDRFFRLIDRVIFKLGIDFSWRNLILKRWTRTFLQSEKFDVIHSNMFKADYLMSEMALQARIPIVITMHGSYENHLKCYINGTGEQILNYTEKLGNHLKRLCGIVYLTEKNLDALHYVKGLDTEFSMPKIAKIYNGFVELPYSPIRREDVGIKTDDFVFGMVARAIPEKGWKYAIEAFSKLDSNAHLVLVGAGDYLNELEKQHPGNDHIHFVGFSSNPLEWISLFDVGLLPSVYDESLPNVVVEYLHLGVPVIATDIGETREMITMDNKLAGRIISPYPMESIATYLHAAMEEILDMTKSELDDLKQSAHKASIQFAFQECLESYVRFYTTVVSAYE